MIEDLEKIPEDPENSEVYILKLVSGETIIADVNVDIEYLFEMTRVQVFLPAALSLGIHPEDGQQYFYLSKWMQFSHSPSFEISTKHIMFADYASDKLLESYEQYVLELKEELMLGLDSEEEETDAKKLLH